MFGAAGVLNTPGVSVCTMATAGMPPPGKADIQPSRAVQQPAHKNTASRNMRSIPEYTHTHTHAHTNTKEWDKSWLAHSSASPVVSFCNKRVGFSTILNVQGQIQTATDNSNNCHYMSSHITEPEKQLEVRKSVITQVEVNMESSGGTSWHNQNRRKFAKESCLSQRSNLLWRD